MRTETAPRRDTMVIVYLHTSVLGALMAVASLLTSGWLVALVCAPLGGSALALAVAMIIVFRTHEEPWDAGAQTH